LHSLGIVHRDVKAQNVLVSADMRELRLVDFNAATQELEGSLTMTGTVDYMPPEALLGESPQEGADIWASGVCLYLMLSGSLPGKRKHFKSLAEFARAMISGGISVDGEAWEQISSACKAVLWQCLEVDLAKRSLAKDVLQNKWMCQWPCEFY
jgi:serine/threonine protein kinase